ncbi:MAG: formyltransferase family protein [Akkermansiaceae bacterium]|jgi:methionyl-tRNA formyltransferase|tara:strand:- start:17143 stop:17733 length:591 start_codon:yes stop_codon:yes gene_type:complete
MKQGKKNGGLTIHQMVEKFDEGPILLRKEVSITKNDVLGTHVDCVAQQAPAGIDALFNYLQNGVGSLTDQLEEGVAYYSRPSTADLTIDWSAMDSVGIESLVHAANPNYQGAVTMFRSTSVYFYEVEAVHLDEPPSEEPGTIVDAPGNPNLYILCRDSACLWVKVASVSNGVFTGERLREIFNVKSGEKFQSPSNL